MCVERWQGGYDGRVVLELLGGAGAGATRRGGGGKVDRVGGEGREREQEPFLYNLDAPPPTPPMPMLQLPQVPVVQGNMSNEGNNFQYEILVMKATILSMSHKGNKPFIPNCHSHHFLVEDRYCMLWLGSQWAISL